MLKRPNELNGGDVVENRRRGHVAKGLEGRELEVSFTIELNRKKGGPTPFMRRVIFGRVSRSREGRILVGSVRERAT